MGIRFYNLNGFFVKKLAHGVNYKSFEIKVKQIKQKNFIKFYATGKTDSAPVFS